MYDRFCDFYDASTMIFHLSNVFLTDLRLGDGSAKGTNKFVL